MSQVSHTVHERGLPPVCLRRVLKHIETHLGNDVAQYRLASIAQLSMDHFARLFRQSTGLPPHRYVLQRRIARARELERFHAERRRSPQVGPWPVGMGNARACSVIPKIL